MEIRSYRKVFDLERRIYRVDRLRLNPGGIPLRGIVYFLALLTVAFVAVRLPLLGSLAGAMPWYLLDIAAPGAGAALLTMIRIEGRPFHLAALALVRYGMGPRQLAGLRPCTAIDRHWRPAELLVLPDGSDSRLRHLRYTGPGAVLVSLAHVRTEWGAGSLRRVAHCASVAVAPLPGRQAPTRAQVIALAPGARLHVRTRGGLRGTSRAVSRRTRGRS